MVNWASTAKGFAADEIYLSPALSPPKIGLLMAELRLTQKTPISDSPFAVYMDEAKMAAYITAADGAGAWEATPDKVNSLLAKIQQIGFSSLDLKRIGESIPKGMKGELILLVNGLAPVNGTDGFIKCNFESNPVEQLWRKDEGEKVDFRNRNEINNVKADQLLATLIDPTSGKAGKDVFGEVIAAKDGKPAVMMPGSNVRLSDDGRQAFATSDGCVKKVKTRISVDKIYVIEGDVDFRTGNVTFNGDVNISGDVKETFTVTAAGSISVAGSVDRANLKAGGDITVQGGAFGKEKICIEAEGCVYLGFAENANIKAGGNIYVKNFLSNSQAEAGEKIYLRAVGKSLIGGQIVAAHGVEANSLGNPRLSTATTVQFGTTAEMAQRIRSLTNEFQRADPERQLEIRKETDALQDEYLKQQTAKVIVRHVTYPGVRLICEKAVYDVKNEIARMIFYKVRNKNEISMRAFLPKGASESQK